MGTCHPHHLTGPELEMGFADGSQACWKQAGPVTVDQLHLLLSRSALSGTQLYHRCQVLLGHGERAVSASSIARSDVVGAVKLG